MHTNLSANIYQTGDSSVFKLDTTLIEKPKAQQVLLKQTAIGVNYIDTYFRSGLYPIDLPATLGDEAVGVIEQVGEGVTEFSVGQRVAYSAAKGAYTQYRVIDINELVPIPDNIDDKSVATSLLRGMTVEYLFCRLHELKPSDVILIHAAAGGVGQIACQWARAVGATVIGTVSSAEKARIAKRNGCDFVINYTEQNFVKAVDEITNGQKVDVVYDGVGKDTFTQSLDCLRVRGLMVSFGNASGKPDPFDVLELSKKGSLYLTRPTLYHYTRNRQEILDSAARYLAMLEKGHINIQVGESFALSDVAKAHDYLVQRNRIGSPVLIP
ncbi:MAG: NADPH2:quinone reductase [Cycloclasticus pugetii]|jgi:NADPH2:quinone reductase|uniref:quinone oxidoreductase family protein n=1 Tax=Cycloclasticus TaxID=34067 RepID=UPI000C118B30|nr:MULTISPECIES: quinone oxidoreductase [Cycloclasticus]MDF1829478.1 quinone oxidoreductase [Cycloclasticus pugetii]PHR50183.1 MAG: quinone oxidoreductase [Cycloclasticus sp.]